MKKIIIHLVIIICSFSLGFTVKNIIEKEDNVILLPEHPFFLLEEVNEEVLYNTLVHYEFPSPSIITAQAILESGNFQSRLCKDNNNLFGLYNSRTKSYFKFDSWISCVFAYKEFILNKYKEGEDYYSFIRRINYASDPSYESKVRKLEKEINNKYKK